MRCTFCQNIVANSSWQNRMFSQIQLLSIGRANNKKLNQLKKKKKKKKRKRQFLGQLRDLLPAVMTYNNNNNKSSQKGKSTGSELLDTKKRWNQWTLWFVPSKVARVCTSTCNDDLVAFFSAAEPVLSTFSGGREMCFKLAGVKCCQWWMVAAL